MSIKNPAIVAFGLYLRKVRQHKTVLSMEGLALKAGLHRNYISMLERGLQNPSLLVIIKIAKALEMSLSDFLSDMPILPIE